jgi:hypothetical protein
MMINFVGFQICWLGLVLLGNSFIPVAIALLLAHISQLVNKCNELKLILTVLCIGAAIDSLLALNGVFIFDSTLVIPIWLIILWGCFAATLLHSLKFLQRSIIFQISSGAVFAPLSYVTGYKLNIVDFSYSLFTTYVILSFIWTPLMVFFFKLAAVFDKEKLNAN